MFKKSIVVFLLAVGFFLSGCFQHVEKPDKFEEIRISLKKMAAKYDQARAELIVRHDAGLIDPETWAYLEEVDLFFDETFSEAMINVNDIHDQSMEWKTPLLSLIDILQIAAPVIDLASGVPVCVPLASAIKIGAGMMEGGHTKRTLNFRLEALKLKTKAILDGK